MRVLPEKFVPVVTTLMYSSDLETKKIEEITGSLKAHEELLNGYQSRNEQRYQSRNEQTLLLKGDTRSDGRRKAPSVAGVRLSPSPPANTVMP